MSDSYTFSSNKRPGPKEFFAKAAIFVAVLYGAAWLASMLFDHIVDWRLYQDPHDRLLWDNGEMSQADVIFLGDSVFASGFINSPDEGFENLVHNMTGKRVFNGALDGADPPDFLKAAQLLNADGVRNATVILDVMPNRGLAFRREAIKEGNYPGQFEHLVGDNIVTRALVKLRQPLIILDGDILANWFKHRRQFYGTGAGRDRVWYRDGDMALRRFEVFRQQVTTGSLTSFDWIGDMDSVLRRSGNRLVVFISPVNNDLVDKYAPGNEAAQYHALHSAAHARLIEYLDRVGIPYIDAMGQVDSDSFADMVHVNKRGNRRFAELITGYLQSNANAQAKSAFSASQAQ